MTEIKSIARPMRMIRCQLWSAGMELPKIDISPLGALWAVRLHTRVLGTFETPAGAVTFAQDLSEQMGDPWARICVRFQAHND